MTNAKDFSLGRLPKRLLPRTLLALALPMTFRTFQFFPGMLYVQEAWFVLCFLIALLVYPFWKMQSGLRFSRFELYLLILMIGDVVLAAWRAQDVFGQPLPFGILAQRSMVLIAILLILVKALRCGMVEVADIEAALLFLAWSTFALYVAMRLLLNPADFVSSGVGFVNPPINGEGASFKLPGYFITFAIFYYAVLGMRVRRKRHYLAAAVLFLSTLGPTGRGYMVCLAVALLAFLYRIRGARAATISAMKFGLVAVALLAVLFVTAPAMLSTRLTGFADAFAVVLTGNPTDASGTATAAAVSANARIFETLTALPYIQEHPLLGNGVISNQWQGGMAGTLGDYFYPSDIGIIGIIFSYGIFGLLLYSYQYRFAWIAAKRIPDYFHSPLLDAVKSFLFFSALYSLQSGLFVWYPETTLFFIAVLGGIAAPTLSSQYSDAVSGQECGLQKLA